MVYLIIVKYNCGYSYSIVNVAEDISERIKYIKNCMELDGCEHPILDTSVVYMHKNALDCRIRKMDETQKYLYIGCCDFGW